MPYGNLPNDIPEPEQWAASEWLRIAMEIRQVLSGQMSGFATMNCQDQKDFVAIVRDALFLEQNALSFEEEVQKQKRLPPPWESQPEEPE